MGNPLWEDLHMAMDAAYFSQKAYLLPDDWQADLLRSQAKQILLNCSRQSGKSTTISTLALHTAIYRPKSMIVLLAPGLRQSTELHRKILTTYRVLGKPVAPDAENKLSLELENGSRILCLPGTEATVRGISGVDLLIVEEAARVPDDLYFSVRPMLATRPHARVVMMSTPFGTRGFFYEAWKSIQRGDSAWQYVEVPAEKCPRISEDFLENERRTIGPFWFEQEYHCVFMDAIDSAFRAADIERMVDKEMEAWNLNIAL